MYLIYIRGLFQNFIHRTQYQKSVQCHFTRQLNILQVSIFCVFVNWKTLLVFVILVQSSRFLFSIFITYRIAEEVFFTMNDSRGLDLFEFKTLQLIILLHQTSHVILQSKLNTMTVSCTKVHVLYYTDNFSVILISLIRKKTSISNYKIWNLELT